MLWKCIFIATRSLQPVFKMRTKFWQHCTNRGMECSLRYKLITIIKVISSNKQIECKTLSKIPHKPHCSGISVSGWKCTDGWFGNSDLWLQQSLLEKDSLLGLSQAPPLICTWVSPALKWYYHLTSVRNQEKKIRDIAACRKWGPSFMSC